MLPYERVRLIAPGPAATTVSKLWNAVSEETWVPIFGKRPQKHFLGIVDPDTFRIRRNIDYRNSWQPVLEGRIVDLGPATEVRVLFRLMAFPMVFTVLWIGFASLAACSITWPMMIGRIDFSWSAMAVWLLPLFGYGLCMGGFLYERNRSLQELKMILSALALGNDGDPSEPTIQTLRGEP